MGGKRTLSRLALRATKWNAVASEPGLDKGSRLAWLFDEASVFQCDAVLVASSTNGKLPVMKMRNVRVFPAHGDNGYLHLRNEDCCMGAEIPLHGSDQLLNLCVSLVFPHVAKVIEASK